MDVTLSGGKHINNGDLIQTRTSNENIFITIIALINIFKLIMTFYRNIKFIHNDHSDTLPNYKVICHRNIHVHQLKEYLCL